MKIFILGLLFLPLLAHADPLRQTYTCDNGSRLDISFPAAEDSRPQAMLHFADTDISLPQVVAASGAAYKQDGIALYTQGEEAYFEDGRGNVRHCLRGQTAPATVNLAASGSFIDLSGKLNFQRPTTLSSNARLKLRVLDTAGPRSRTLAEQVINLPGGTGPIDFQITLDRDLLGKKPHLKLIVRLEQGKRLLLARSYPIVFHDGLITPLDIILPAKTTSRNQP